jgi:membrane-associated phospholipid phosphatase
MQTVLAAPTAGARTSWTAGLRQGEKIALAYFLYVASIGFVWPLSIQSRALLCAVPVALWFMATIETRRTQRWSSVTRDWLSIALILVAYWELNFFRSPPMIRAQEIWVGWDRMVLDGLGLRSAIEAGGSTVPALLEVLYLCLYAIPPLCMALLYSQRQRRSADRFLLTLFTGTFTAYALLPFFSSISPRMAFPSLDSPGYLGVARAINTWVLDHLDISTSVFPSGHVAVAFSSAFGLMRVMPQRRRIWVTAFTIAVLVYVATIYGRYHYAVDGLASIAIVFACSRVVSRWSVE